MSHETELKLSLPEDEVEALKQHPFWEQYASEPETFHLGNTYFDTPDMQLNQARLALRIREKNGQYFHTLKTKGESINGLTRRSEWEWPVASFELDIDGLHKVWPEHLPDIDTQRLKPLFTTNFVRTCWNIQWAEPEASIEAVLDVGQAVAGEKSSPICELELELLDGDEGVLVIIAGELASNISLTPSGKSKAERGIELTTHKPGG